MRVSRRAILSGIGASLLMPARGQGAPNAVYLGARVDADGAASVAAFDLDGRERFACALPARGHDMAVRPGQGEFVVFARRPGRFALVVDAATGGLRHTIAALPERHFYGHGVYSADGRLLYCTENGLDDGDGRIGVYNVGNGYTRIGEFASAGVGPHDIALLPGGQGRLAVANGGIRTHPSTGRDVLNLDSMRPNLALIDAASGECLERIELPDDLRLSSLRHIDVDAGGRIAFGCQWAGDKAEAPPLVGLIERGRARLFDMPETDLGRLAGYIGSVAFDARGAVIAATAPNGGALVLFDAGSGRYLGQKRITDVCGIAAVPAAGAAALGAGAFVASSGNAGVRLVAVEDERMLPEPLRRFVWDNHLRLLRA